MAITFPDPDVLQYSGIHEAIASVGYSLMQANGVWVAGGSGTPEENEAAVQAIINAYDIRVDMRKAKILEIKTEGLSRINAVFPAIDSIDELEYQSELWASIKTTAKQTTAKMQSVIDIYAAARTAIIAVNNATTKAAILAVTVNWPA
jgi:hypothetical protein